MEETGFDDEEAVAGQQFGLAYLIHITHLFESASAPAWAVQFATRALQFASTRKVQVGLFLGIYELY